MLKNEVQMRSFGSTYYQQIVVWFLYVLIDCLNEWFEKTTNWTAVLEKLNLVKMGVMVT